MHNQHNYPSSHPVGCLSGNSGLKELAGPGEVKLLSEDISHRLSLGRLYSSVRDKHRGQNTEMIPCICYWVIRSTEKDS